MAMNMIGNQINLDTEGIKRTILDNKELLEDRAGELTEYARRIRQTTDNIEVVTHKYKTLLDSIESLGKQIEDIDTIADEAWGTSEAYSIDD